MNGIQRLALDTLCTYAPAEMDAFAIKRVQSMGKLIVDPSATVLPAGEVPEVGEWRPTRGKALARTVAVCWSDDVEVFYLKPDGRAGTCTLATWHRWVRRTRAVRG